MHFYVNTGDLTSYIKKHIRYNKQCNRLLYQIVSCLFNAMLNVNVLDMLNRQIIQNYYINGNIKGYIRNSFTVVVSTVLITTAS